MAEKTIADLLRMIPRSHTHRIVNQRMRDLFRVLSTEHIEPENLKFFEQEINLCRNKYEKWKEAYKRYRSIPEWEATPPPPDPHGFSRSWEE